MEVLITFYCVVAALERYMCVVGWCRRGRCTETFGPGTFSSQRLGGTIVSSHAPCWGSNFFRFFYCAWSGSREGSETRPAVSAYCPPPSTCGLDNWQYRCAGEHALDMLCMYRPGESFLVGSWSTPALSTTYRWQAHAASYLPPWKNLRDGAAGARILAAVFYIDQSGIILGKVGSGRDISRPKNHT